MAPLLKIVSLSFFLWWNFPTWWPKKKWKYEGIKDFLDKFCPNLSDLEAKCCYIWTLGSILSPQHRRIPKRNSPLSPTCRQIRSGEPTWLTKLKNKTWICATSIRVFQNLQLNFVILKNWQLFPKKRGKLCKFSAETIRFPIIWHNRKIQEKKNYLTQPILIYDNKFMFKSEVHVWILRSPKCSCNCFN
jgi:hypothetical protein